MWYSDTSVVKNAKLSLRALHKLHITEKWLVGAVAMEPQHLAEERADDFYLIFPEKSNSCAVFCWKIKSPVVFYLLIDLNIRLRKAVSYNLGKDHYFYQSEFSILSSYCFSDDSCLQFPLSLLLNHHLSCFSISAHFPHTKIKLGVNCKHKNICVVSRLPS